MSDFSNRRMTLATKHEAVEGTAETLTGAEANLLAYDPQFTPNVNLFARKPIANDFSPYSAIPGAQSMRATFKAELKGSGTAGTEPAIGKLLEACGFAKTVNPGVSVVYQRALGTPSLTLGLYALPSSGNNLRKLIHGARGTFKLNPRVGDPPMIEFDFLGVYSSISDIAGITPGGLENEKPVPFKGTSFTMQTFAHKISQFSIDAGNALALRGDIAAASGYKSCLIVDSDATFSFDPETELVATHDYHGIMLAGAEGSMTVTIGSVAGNICTITAPKCQYAKVGPGDRDGISTFSVDGKFNRNAGNDELVFTFT